MKKIKWYINNDGEYSFDFNYHGARLEAYINNIDIKDDIWNCCVIFYNDPNEPICFDGRAQGFENVKKLVEKEMLGMLPKYISRLKEFQSELRKELDKK